MRQSTLEASHLIPVLIGTREDTLVTFPKKILYYIQVKIKAREIWRVSVPSISLIEISSKVKWHSKKQTF